MEQKKYRFSRKWHVVLHELFMVFSNGSWKPLSINNAWYASDRAYLRFRGITTYVSFEHHIRRLRQWEYLYKLPRPKRASRYDPNHYTYLLSKAGINKLIALGVVQRISGEEIKKTIHSNIRYYKIAIKR